MRLGLGFGGFDTISIYIEKEEDREKYGLLFSLIKMDIYIQIYLSYTIIQTLFPIVIQTNSKLDSNSILYYNSN